MKTLLQNLIRLQQLELEEVQVADATKVIADLRKQIPPQILGHYDRLMARGKKGIVPVRGQACTGCHMRLPIGAISELMKAEDIQLCDSCGRYLYLEEVVGLVAAPPAPEPATPVGAASADPPGQKTGPRAKAAARSKATAAPKRVPRKSRVSKKA